MRSKFKLCCILKLYPKIVSSLKVERNLKKMNNKPNVYLGNTRLYSEAKTISSSSIYLDGEPFFVIENYDQMAPFFMTIVSDADLWMYISSTGGLTCGRMNAESSLFPYYTDDKIHDSNETTGSHTLLMVTQGDKNYLWKPFSTHSPNVYNITRKLYKNALGNKIKFEEINHDLDVSFGYTWKSSNTYGFVKSSILTNLAESEVSIKLLDGIRNILPYGVNTMLQTTRSTLVDGYKRCELEEVSGLGIYTLSSILTDKAEPSESLKATTVWSTGIEQPVYLLSEQQINKFCQSEALSSELDVKGRRGSYYVTQSIQLEKAQVKEWSIVAQLNQSAADVEKLIHEIQVNPMIQNDVNLSIEQGDKNLKKLVFEADGFQMTANEKVGYRHFSNTLFNIMRGGIYAQGYVITTTDFIEFASKWNKKVVEQNRDFIQQLPEKINYTILLSITEQQNDADLLRLVYEYLPLTYSRRHGDPSRPWNKFNIDITKEDGSKKLKFEGNWRDIFQNWEALSVSFPGYIESIISKFVNASTADGYNPYRITKDGIDWELLDPEDPWSNIGYWGDHQLIYLLKLMELSKSYNADKLFQLLQKDIFVYANVPYKIKGFDDLVADPRNSILFDYDLEDSITNRVKSIGSDGKLILLDEKPLKVNLMEKLLVTLLSKFSNFVPEGGIWMNTQRPEWNDANNALVGNGLSMVTLYYLNRFLVYMKAIVEETLFESFDISEEVLQLFHKTMNILDENKQTLNQKISDKTRFSMVEALGRIGEIYRNTIYKAGFCGDKGTLSKQSIKEFIEVALLHLEESIKKNKREDGLYHAYNLIKFDTQSCSISYLNEMLEGQVAVLSSKALDSKEVLGVLKSLRHSSIYRDDQKSYMLYPNRELPKFLEKNIVPESDVLSSVVLRTEIELEKRRFIEKDINGKYHFNGQFRNSEELVAAITETNEYQTNQYKKEDAEEVGEIFAQLFNHHAFTGRSGTFYKYEGLGCIYWHMVSKLALATQENFLDELSNAGMTPEATNLSAYYETIKAGIGLEKSPSEYGAFTTDAYSHTPGFAGVQQPGMTGQVKEDFIARFGELGVKVSKGRISFEPSLLSPTEFLTEATTWYLPLTEDGNLESIQLEKDSLGFTFCAIPIIYHIASEKKIVMLLKDNSEIIFENSTTLDAATSQSIFERDPRIKQVEVFLSIK